EAACSAVRDGMVEIGVACLEQDVEQLLFRDGVADLDRAIAEKKLLDVLLQARDANLYHAITDCGAGGFSSAVGEMGADLGATVHLEKAPLKYQGLSYTEIWISESQERMVLAVPPENWDRLRKLCEAEDVEACTLGVFEETGKLRLFYEGQNVGELSMQFLHDGRPEVLRKATWQPPAAAPASVSPPSDYNAILIRMLGSLNIASKEWIIRQYDHEVQGGSVIKPLVGIHEAGPSDASVIAPILGSWVGLAVGCGINPHLGDLDPYAMAASTIDEAVRNVVAVGADPSRVALLDNFCWGNTDRPEVLGSLVLAAEACRDLALAYRMPFISGKDSLKNEYRSGDRHITIPPTLLISAMGRIADVRQCVTMDLKEVGNVLFLVGTTSDEMGGSHFHLVEGRKGGKTPRPDIKLAPRLFNRLHEAIRRGLVRSCHDLSEGGLAVAIAEMAFAGGIGADLTKISRPDLPDFVSLFSESTSRFILEVRPGNIGALEECFKDIPLSQIGHTVKEHRLRVAGSSGEWIIWSDLNVLEQAWRKPLNFS
ncbi:MAG: AIR synthase-related protein, partial [Gemmataceae bacterium]